MSQSREALAQSVRQWYEESHLDMGYLVERRRFGCYRSSVYLPGWINVTVRGVEADEADAFLADLRSVYPGQMARILIDDPSLDASLGPGLIAGGCSPAGTVVHLAHRDQIPAATQPPRLSIEPVTDANLPEFVATEHRAFSGDESDVPAEELAQEMALRQAERSGVGRFELARLADEPAAVIGWYDSPDRLIFLLGTRPFYRRLGIASALLHHALEDAARAGCHSVIINGDPSDSAVQLYRRVGFSQEVYWQRCYLLG